MAEETFLKDDNKISLETTSKYQGVTDTNLQFYNMDTGTSVLNFIVTKNGLPFEIGPYNAQALIVLKTDNYGVDTGAYISDKLNFEDPINGKLSYILPNELLKYTGKVHGQVYFVQNGNSNVIVEREFTFTIADDLISDFDGLTKLTYIKTLKDLTENLQEDVMLIKKSLTDATTIIDGVKNETKEGIRQLEVKKDEISTLLTSIEDEKIAHFKSLTDDFIQEADTRKQLLNNRLTEIENQMKSADLINGNDTVNWQKHKLVNDNGIATEVYDTTIQTLLDRATSSHFYHVNLAQDAPTPPSETIVEDINAITDGFEEIEKDDEYVEITPPQQVANPTSGILIIYRGEYQGRAIWYPDDKNDVYMCGYSENRWSDWKRINDERVNKDYIDTSDSNTLQAANAYTDNKISNNPTQQYKLTETTGQSINKDFKYTQTELVSLSAGNYYGVNVPDLPVNISSTEGYLTVYVKDEYSKYYEFTPKGSNRTLIRQLTSGTLNEWTDLSVNAKTVLFDGTAKGVGTELALNDDYTKYSLLILSGNYPGGTFNEVSSTLMSQSIIISKTNVQDNEGTGGGLYEAVVVKVNNTTLRIGNDAYYDFGLNKGYGPNAGKITINKVVGWR